jgi:NAD(P)-dependent dehydrogenase (short-subunit alcohol dehydrogenase family)
MLPVMKSSWLITGSSTGFGRILAEELAKAGHSVLATARRPEALDDLRAAYPDLVTTAQVDVTDRAQVAAAIKMPERLDVVVNNAGYGLFGAVEEASEDEIKRQFDTNIMGAIHVMQLAAERMRGSGGGRILNLSSIAGLASFPAAGFYCATKHALEALSEALDAEASPLGIRAIAIEPGPFRTDFHGRSLAMAEREIADYAETAGARRKLISGMDGNQAGDPVRAAHIMMDLAAHPNPPKRLLLGANAYERAMQTWDERRADAEAWREVTLSADYPDA